MESNYILIQPFAKSMRNNKKHPKDYPHWIELVAIILTHIPEYHIIQLGVESEFQLVSDFRKGLHFKELELLVDNCSTWIGVDSFLQHLGWYRKKKGIAIFAKQDPLIFGHKENINLLVDKNRLRQNQFWMHEQTEFDEDDFVGPEIVFRELELLLKN